MTQYIITEEQIKDIEDGDLTLKQLEEIRSRPYNVQAERERVLDELYHFLENANKKRFALWELMQVIKNLRQEGGGAE